MTKREAGGREVAEFAKIAQGSSRLGANQPIRIGSIFVMQRGSEQHDSDDVLYESRSKEYWFSAAQFNAGVTRLQETLIECRQSYSNPAKLLEMDPAKAALPARAMKRWMRYLNDITGKTKRAAKAGYNQQLNIQYSTVEANQYLAEQMRELAWWSTAEVHTDGANEERIYGGKEWRHNYSVNQDPLARSLLKYLYVGSTDNYWWRMTSHGAGSSMDAAAPAAVGAVACTAIDATADAVPDTAPNAAPDVAADAKDDYDAASHATPSSGPGSIAVLSSDEASELEHEQNDAASEELQPSLSLNLQPEPVFTLPKPSASSIGRIALRRELY